jgi:hypothetical protein
MAILQAILAELLNYVGTILNTAFGWATLMLFGKVPKDRQLYVTLSSIGAVVWLIALLGIAFPAVAVFIFSFVKLPKWVDQAWIRLAMLSAACALPALVGFDSLYTMPPSRRPKGTYDKAKAIIRGYPYTIGLSVTVLTMCIFAPLMQLRNMARRWTSTHIPMMVESHNYFDVVEAIQETLSANGIATRRSLSSWLLRMPTKFLAFLAGGAVHDLVAENLTTLIGANLEIMLHPSDLVIRGPERDVARAHAVITERLGFTRAYLTWDEEANRLEDILCTAWQQITTGELEVRQAQHQIAQLDEKLKNTYLPYEEWEILFREKLLLEHELLRRIAPQQLSAA